MPKFSVETEIDKLICNISEAQARCMMKIDSGICDPNDCVNCDVRRNIDTAIANLSAGDNLAIHNKTEDILISASHADTEYKREKFKTAGSILKDVLKTMGILFIVAIVIPILLLLFFVRAKPYEFEDDSYVVPVLMLTHQYVYDVDGDTLVDCCDYAITFKMMWDYLYSGYESDCEIVRNKHPDASKDFHHLFVRCRHNYNAEWIYIEPQALPVYDNKMYMHVYWRDRYNPLFNYYGETDKWLSTVKR